MDLSSGEGIKFVSEMDNKWKEIKEPNLNLITQQQHDFIHKEWILIEQYTYLVNVFLIIFKNSSKKIQQKMRRTRVSFMWLRIIIKNYYRNQINFN